MCRLTTGIRSKKCVVRRFRRCANVYVHKSRSVFLNRPAAARYRALASIIPGREKPEETTVCYKISLVQLITNLNVILYLSTCHTVYISVLILCGNKMPTRCNRGFLLQILLLAQHVSGIIMPIIRSSRVLYSGCCLWYFVLCFFQVAGLVGS